MQLLAILAISLSVELHSHFTGFQIHWQENILFEWAVPSGHEVVYKLSGPQVASK